MNGSRSTPTRRSWRMRQWPNDPTIAQLVFIDHSMVPAAEDVAHAVEHARRRGARAIRTSALFPRTADIVLGVGFEAIDHLSLMAVDLTSAADPAPLRPTTLRPTTLRAWNLWEAAEVDRAAFGPLWGNDARALREIRRATPRHRARQIRSEGSMAGFVVSGAAGDQGYIQRLAVRPDRHRQGHAASLVADALGWMRSTGLGRALVNTGTDNAPALALYERFGFRSLDDILTVAELRLAPGDRGGAVASEHSPSESPAGSPS